jgi:hypothetical protein
MSARRAIAVGHFQQEGTNLGHRAAAAEKYRSPLQTRDGGESNRPDLTSDHRIRVG